ncbi:unnamed protein product [Penicillium pancosmium]
MSEVPSPEIHSTCDCPEGYDSDSSYSFGFGAGSVAPEDSLSQGGRRPRSPSRGGSFDPCSHKRPPKYIWFTDKTRLEFLSWWKFQTIIGKDGDLKLCNNKRRRADIWLEYYQVADIHTGKPMMMCKLCYATLGHPAATNPGNKVPSGTSAMRRHYDSPTCWVKFHQNEEDCDEVLPYPHLARTATDVFGLTPDLQGLHNLRREFNMRCCPEGDNALLDLMEYVRLCPVGNPTQWPPAKELERYCQEKDRELEEAGEKTPKEGTGSWKVLGPTACDRLQDEDLI